jgi:hypothetical protein
MNAVVLTNYIHEWFIKKVNALPQDKWDQPGATGTWSCKDILSHVTSYEIKLIPVLEEFVNSGQSTLNPFPEDHQKFNDEETSKRKDKNYQEIIDEYNQAHNQVMELINQIPQEKFSEVGALTWYGQEYSLDDYLVYRDYGHKKEHGTQIDVFADHLK